MTDIEKIVLSIIKNKQSKIYTSIPAKIYSYDEVTQLATIKIVDEIDGVEIDPIAAVPVHHVGGKNWQVITQIDIGSEGMLCICMRDISNWLFDDKKELSNRQFSLTDSYFLSGIRSKKGSAKNVVNNGIQLRSDDGKHYVWLKNNGDCHISGNLHVEKQIHSVDSINSNSTINAQEEMTAKGEVVARITHTHKYTDSGSQVNPKDTQKGENH